MVQRIKAIWLYGLVTALAVFLLFGYARNFGEPYGFVNGEVNCVVASHQPWPKIWKDSVFYFRCIGKTQGVIEEEFFISSLLDEDIYARRKVGGKVSFAVMDGVLILSDEKGIVNEGNRKAFEILFYVVKEKVDAEKFVKELWPKLSPVPPGDSEPTPKDTNPSPSQKADASASAFL